MALGLYRGDRNEGGRNTFGTKIVFNLRTCYTPFFKTLYLDFGGLGFFGAAGRKERGALEHSAGLREGISANISDMMNR